MELLQTDWTSKWALYSPDQPAVKEFETGRGLSYARLDSLANRLAYYLHSSYGISKGDRIAVLADNCLEYLVLFATAQKNGVTLVPLNYRLAAAELDYLLDNAKPALIIWEEKYERLLTDGHQFRKVPHRWPLEAFAEFCDQAPDGVEAPFPAESLEADHPIFILYTSGTTGFPKGALYTHKMLFWNSINTAMSLIVNSESRTINVMPPFHTGGWNVLTTPFLHHGGYSCLMKKFEAKEVLQALTEEKPTIFMAVPTMLKMIAESPGFSEADLSSLHYLIVGGEPMPIPLIETWHSKGIFVRQGFGMTEVGPNLTSLHHRDAIRKKGSIGRPNFYVDIRIVDGEGQDLPANTPGELLLKGPMVTPGYWRNPEATAKSIRNGWFHSGDMVKMDEEGYIYVVDRIKNMFISGGENVYPAEIERVLNAHPKISAAAVIGVPDDKWGEVGKAFIVHVAGQTITVEEVREYCQSRLARFKVPKYIVLLSELPLSPTGKINRMALKDIKD